MTLLGHKSQETQLLSWIQKQRLPSGLMLTGPQGIGKATLAQDLAAYLLAGESSPTLHVPPSHPVVRRMMSGGHGDYLYIQKGLTAEGKPQRDIPISEVRKVVEFMHKTPLEGGWRVVVIDSIDEMNRNAANALLKVLEEPPAHALLLLVCHAPGKVLPTIKSRCQELLFHPLNRAEMKTFLKAQSLEDFEIDEVIELGEGRPGYALHMIEAQGLAVYKDLLTAMTTSQTIGASAYFSLIDKYGDAAPKTGGPDLFTTLGNLTLSCLTRLVDWSVTQRASSIPEEASAFQAALTTHPIEHWIEMWQKTITEFNQAQRFSLNRKQVLAGLYQHFA